MAERLTMTRGQLNELLARLAAENPKYREALINDPKITVKSMILETLDEVFVVVPHVTEEGELSESDLEKVSGGILHRAQCR